MTFMMIEEMMAVMGCSYRNLFKDTIQGPVVGLRSKDILMLILVDENVPLK